MSAGRLRRLFTESLWIALGQAMAVAGSLAGVRLLTELLDPASYGELALGITVATLVNQTILGPLGNGTARFYAPAAEKNEMTGYLRAVRRLALSATAATLAALALAALGLLAAGRPEWTAFTASATLFAVLSGHGSILGGIQNAARQRAVAALHQGLAAWAQPIAAAGLVLNWRADGTAAMAGYALAALLVLSSQSVFFRRIAAGQAAGADEEKTWREKIWRFSWPFSTWGVFTWAQLASDRWALEIFASTEDVGLYSALFQLGYSPMSMATGMAMQLLAPILFQRAGEADDSRRSASANRLTLRLVGGALGMTALAFLAASLLHGQIFKILVAGEYWAASHLLPWMLLSGGIFAAGQSITLNLASQMKTQAMIAPKIVTALLGAAFNIAGARWFGIEGIVFASVLFSSLYFAWLVILSLKAAPR